MRIALVSPYDWCVDGGVNRHIAQLARWFEREGEEPVIFAPASVPESVDDAETIGRPVAVHASGSVQRIALGWTSAKVEAALGEGRFDVVHLHEPLMPFLPYHFLRHSRTANVGTFHAAKEGGNRIYSYTRHFTRRYFRKLDGKITVSVAASRLVSRYFRGYFNVIPNGIEYDHFGGEGVEPLPEFMDGRFNILFVGRPEKRKGLQYLLRAYTEIRDSLERPARLIVVGAGDLSRYERAMRGFDEVVFRSNVSYEELPRYHRSAHVFCAPNTGNESQGIALLEAMAAGVPVIASNIEGFATMVTHEREGLLVPPRDHDELARALQRAISMGESLQPFGERGQALARRYSWDYVAQQVLSYYERIVWERQQAADLRAGPR